jgi:heme exporter protein D
MFIVKMEGFAGFVGLMFGLVVLSVIITLVVCAVKRHRREWLQDGQYGHEIEMYTVEQGEKRDKRQ